VFLFFAAPTLLVAAAVVLVVVGLRGRKVDDHPLCRRCGFDLVGLMHPRNCPECGSLLTLPRTTKVGHRRRHKVPLAIGLVLLLLLAGGGTFVGIAASRGYNFNKITPEWLLELKAGSSDAGYASGALTELGARTAAGKIDAGRLVRLIARGLALQQDQQTVWVPGWGDLIEAAHAQGLLSAQDRHQYARNAFHIDSVFIAQNPQGHAIGIKLSRVRTGNAWGTLLGQFELLEVSAKGGTARFSVSGTTRAGVNVAGGSVVNVILQNLDVGFDSPRVLVSSRWRIQALEPDGSVAAEWIETPPQAVIERSAANPPDKQ
jgi:hypothetical protein